MKRYAVTESEIENIIRSLRSRIYWKSDEAALRSLPELPAVEAETCENPKVSSVCDGCAYDDRGPFENPCSFCKMGSEFTIKSGRE